jgi:hypothetical protein
MKYILLLLLSFSALALQNKISSQTYDEAKAKTTQLEFMVTSTKVGIFTSYVYGYVKEFNYFAARAGNTLTNMKVEFSVNSMTTDHGDRDEKLHNLCMSSDKYPMLVMTIPGPLKLEEGLPQELEGVALIRGKQKTFKVQAVYTKKLVVLNSTWSLKEMEIPDPSIAVATLGDDIKIKVQINLEKDL